MRLLVLLALLLVAAAPAIPAAEREIRVRIVHTLERLEMKALHGTQARDAAGKEVRLAPGEELVAKVTADGVALHDGGGSEVLRSPLLTLRGDDATTSCLLLRKVPFGIGWWWAGTEDRPYSGVLEFRRGADGKLEVVVQLPVERYLCGVVPTEIGASGTPMEALKAQAVAARSETMRALEGKVYAGAHHDICSDVECQAYSGDAKRSAATDAAVRATAGLVLKADGKTLAAYYASNCGGCSEPVENVWPSRSGPKPYWTNRFDWIGAPPKKLPDLTTEPGVRAWIADSPAVACNPAHTKGLPAWAQKNFRWERKFTAAELQAMVARKKDIGRIVGIDPGKRGPSGRLLSVTFVGERGNLTVGPELAIRQVFDPPLRSACFVVNAEGPSNPPSAFTITGAGWGHGVGMCQTGAIARALAGQDFRAILAHYYPTTTVE